MTDNEESQQSEAYECLQDLQHQLTSWERLSSQYNGEFRAKLQSALTLLKMHTQSYQRIIITRRRRAQQRRKKRQMDLRNFFLQMMEDVQIQLMEMLPLCIEPSMLMKIAKEKSDEQLRQWEATESSRCSPGTFRFFEDVVCGFSNEEQWVNTFHMSKTSFNLFCAVLKEVLDSDDMSQEELIAMCIYIMATGSSFRSVGLLFNKPQTFVRSGLYKFVEVLIQTFEDQFLKMPRTLEEISKVCRGFSRASHMPSCCLGVLCVFELPTFPHTRPGSKAYGMDRVIVQTLIDDRLQFRKVEVAHQQPSMFLRTPNEIENISQLNADSTTLPYFVTAPAQYPLRSWLMQKFEQPGEQCEQDFNEALSNLNIFRELALQRLFGRWQILSSSELFIEPESKGLLAKACCILHNILEDCGELYSEDWSGSTDLNKYAYKFEESESFDGVDHEDAEEKRNRIARLIQRERGGTKSNDE